MQEGDRVYVTKEEEGMCLGICNNCFGKFPKDILMPLSTDEVTHYYPMYIYTVPCLVNILSVATVRNCIELYIRNKKDILSV